LNYFIYLNHHRRQLLPKRF